MSEMLVIQDFVQEIAQATSLALNLNVEIVDRDLLRVAGTGLSKIKVGKYFRKVGVVNRFIFEKGMDKIIIGNPGIDPQCSMCDLYGNCDTTAAVYASIIVGEETIGAIGLLAHDESQAVIIDENNKVMLDFVNSMAALISSKLRERRMVIELKSSLKFNTIVMNNIHKGILILDNNGFIVDANEYMVNKLNITYKKFVNNRIHCYFLNFDFDSINDSNVNKLEYEFNGKRVKFIYQVQLITIDDDISKIVLIIDDERDIFQSAEKIKRTQKSVNFDDIVSKDPNFINFKNIVKDISRYESTVLLTGETGTGKELFARAIHENSKRKSKPYIVVDCGSLPDNLIESELFGYEKGAFTGAREKGKKGKFHLAHKGTIFLDELENMPLFLQQKLLRVLEERTIEPLGSTEGIHVDVRVIVATNKNLQDLVKEGKFREDLYHRINVIPLNIPPLRERGKDIIILANHFIDEYDMKFNKKIKGMSKEVERIFDKYEWKGNIRELQNVVEYSVMLCKDDYIGVGDLPIHIKDYIYFDNPTTLKELERKHIKHAIDKFGVTEKGKLEAAKYLGVSRSTIYRKIREYELGDSS